MHTQAKRSWRRLARLAVARDELRAAKLKLVEAREEVARIDHELQKLRDAKPVAARTRGNTEAYAQWLDSKVAQPTSLSNQHIPPESSRRG